LLPLMLLPLFLRHCHYFDYDIIDTLADFHAMPLRHFHILFSFADAIITPATIFRHYAAASPLFSLFHAPLRFAADSLFIFSPCHFH
jgi:hypothetical protein